ncbi:Peptidase S8/S53 domain containing protein [Parasponia andersonii]|uniref:Peptidase S8/S53 domain containing protein n=1 Tax=Parasponia andersonii TaxID=3476 RepID=A0A2P5BEM9_PARAD|nr:Peptidase S8/S53 domain containing protein [Parasponia andersonii]
MAPKIEYVVTGQSSSHFCKFGLATLPTEENCDKRQFPFSAESRTSVSCPDVFGLVVLLKTLHSDYSPATIPLAIMASDTKITSK